jgi:hypothetical protein
MAQAGGPAHAGLFIFNGAQSFLHKGEMPRRRMARRLPLAWTGGVGARLRGRIVGGAT